MRLDFTESEKARELNRIDLGLQGEFYAEHIEPDRRRVYGWWFPTEEGVKEFNELYDEDIDYEDRPFWASIDYVPIDYMAVRRERDLISDVNAAMAHHFLEFTWGTWVIYLEYEGEEGGLER